MRTGRPKVELLLTDEERSQLQAFARSRSLPAALSNRARIVLSSADGEPNNAIAERLRLTKSTVGKWRARFIERRLVSGADKTAVALQQRQFVGQRLRKFLRQRTRRFLQTRAHGLDFRRCHAHARKPRQHLIGGGDAVAQGREIARTATAEREPRHRPRHVGRAA